MVAAQEIPKDHAILQCEICRSNIGIFKPEDLKSPIDSSMFKSIDAFHGFPPPFPPGTDGRGQPLTWEFARCPYCRTRPFMERDRVKTPYGFIKVGDTEIPRPRTVEDDNQEKITEAWQKDQYASMTLEERNQQKINKAMTGIISDIKIASINQIKENSDFKDSEHIENHILTDEDVKGIKDVKPQENITSDFKANKSLLKGRCQFCGRKYKRDDFKKKHEEKCDDNPKNQKEGKK